MTKDRVAQPATRSRRIAKQLGRLISWTSASTWLCSTCLLAPSVAAYGGGIDREWILDQSGIWGRGYQSGLEYGVIALEVTGSLWLGNDNEMGHTFWQTIDASVIAGVSADVLKYATGRPRPYQENNANVWFKGTSYQSFPSGEVTLQASFVTPFVVNYARRDPWILCLELLPVYDAIARLKSQAHWPTDVIAGFALGSAVGYWATTRSQPFAVQVLPKGISIGFDKRF